MSSPSPTYCLLFFFFLSSRSLFTSFFFFFNDTATTEIYTLSLHDALPISRQPIRSAPKSQPRYLCRRFESRSEEHTSELQSPCNLVCRLLLEKKKKTNQAPAQSSAYSAHRRTLPA